MQYLHTQRTILIMIHLRLLLCTTAVFFGINVVPSIAHGKFLDVPSSHQYSHAIEYVQSQGIVQGYADGSFRPDHSINRAEFTKILITSKYSQGAIAQCLGNIQVLFSDTPLNAWYTPFICMAFHHMGVSGYPDRSFKPGSAINMAEAAKILVHGYQVPIPERDYPTNEPIDDYDPIDNSFWWMPYIEALKESDSLPSTYQSPDQLVTRGEMADMIFRLQNPGAST